MERCVVQINGALKGSTGKIMLAIREMARMEGLNVYVAYPITRSNRKVKTEQAIKISTVMGNLISRRLGFYTGYLDCFSYFSTRHLISKLRKIKPYLIHLHNIHNSYLNLNLLFRYIREVDCKIIWTMHDCWPFTGRCSYFDMIDCDKWKKQCMNCPSLRNYPEALVDRTQFLYNMKRKLFTSVNDMVIVTPSQWLARLVGLSFLKYYPINIIYNGIDISIFHPRQSDFREKYGLQGKFIVLGVAFIWGVRKGLDIFRRLEKDLPNSASLVLIGVSRDIAITFGRRTICISRTDNQEELAQIYSAADVFVNPTREDNFPTVNLEALACGTPVITWNTGGSPEAIDSTCGIVVNRDDYDGILSAVTEISGMDREQLRENCVHRATAFRQEEKYGEYVKLYKQFMKG